MISLLLLALLALLYSAVHYIHTYSTDRQTDRQTCMTWSGVIVTITVVQVIVIETKVIVIELLLCYYN